MKIRLVDAGWSREIADAIRLNTADLRIISPFIKGGALARLLQAGPETISAITRFNLADFADGVSDISALRHLLARGAKVRGVKNLHAKMYVFGSKRAIVTSANLTIAALDRNHEFGLVSDDADIVAACRRYFDDMWERGGTNLSAQQLDQWDQVVTRHRAEGGKKGRSNGLGDMGTEAGLMSSPPIALPTVVADAPQAFVKFFGQGNHREPLSYSTIDQVGYSGCHWALSYPATKRPRGVRDGALMFIARLTKEPNDIRVFGRAIGIQHVQGRDDATREDIHMRPFKETWSRYIRVHRAEFVAGQLRNGVSLNELMLALGSNAFISTERNAANGQGNTDPRRAFMQQPAVQLSGSATKWLSEKLQQAFERYGTIPQNDLDQLDWPEVPLSAGHANDAR